MSSNRYILDANLIVSAALLPASPARKALNTAFKSGQILMSQAMLEEIHEVLQRPKFDRYLTQVERLEFLTSLITTVERVSISESISVCRDPKDNKYLEAGVSGKATTIITGDEDLLVRHPLRGIQIVSPLSFLSAVSSEDREAE